MSPGATPFVACHHIDPEHDTQPFTGCSTLVACNGLAFEITQKRVLGLGMALQCFGNNSPEQAH